MTSGRAIGRDSDPRHRVTHALLLGAAAAWPLLGAVLAFFSIRRPLAKWILVAFSAIVGYRFVIDDPRYDSYRLASFAQEIAALDWTAFSSWVSAHCFVSEKCIDPAQPMLTFLFTRLGGHEIAFAGYAVVFAIFCFGSLGLVRKDFAGHSRIFNWVLLSCLFFLNPLHNIGGFRFNAATWILFYGFYRLYKLENRSGLAWIFLAVVFHYSMVFPAALLLAFRWIPKRPSLANITAMASYALTAPVAWLSGVLSFDVGLGSFQRARRYIDEEYMSYIAAQHEQAFSGSFAFTAYQQIPMKVVLLLFLAYCQFRLLRRLRELPAPTTNCYSAAVLLFAAANIFSSIPSMSRFIVIGIMCVMAATVSLAGILSRREKLVMLGLLIPAVLWWLAAPMRIALATLDLYSMLPSVFLFFDRTPLIGG